MSQDTFYYNELRWPELQALAEKNAIVLIPIGQTEEHGPHSPVGTDQFIAEATAAQVAAAVMEEIPVLVTPPVWAGFSGKDLFNWPGAISMPPEVVISVVENICISLDRSGFGKLLLMNSHGHHEGVLRVAARKVADRCDACVVVSNIWKMAHEAVNEIRDSELGGCCHAGEYETSLMLHLDKRVDMTAARDEPVRPHSQFVGGDNFSSGSKVFWSTWRYQKSTTGTYGSPTSATAEKGRDMMAGTVAAYVQLLRDLHAAP